jgi:hypothetical protein
LKSAGEEMMSLAGAINYFFDQLIFTRGWSSLDLRSIAGVTKFNNFNHRDKQKDCRNAEKIAFAGNCPGLLDLMLVNARTHIKNCSKPSIVLTP